MWGARALFSVYCHDYQLNLLGIMLIEQKRLLKNAIRFSSNCTQRNLQFVMSSLLTCQFRFDAHSQHERGVVLSRAQSGLDAKAAYFFELWHVLSEYFHKLRLIYPIGHDTTVHWN